MTDYEQFLEKKIIALTDENNALSLRLYNLQLREKEMNRQIEKIKNILKACTERLNEAE